MYGFGFYVILMEVLDVKIIDELNKRFLKDCILNVNELKKKVLYMFLML